MANLLQICLTLLCYWKWEMITLAQNKGLLLIETTVIVCIYLIFPDPVIARLGKAITKLAIYYIDAPLLKDL